jgi:putative peptide maturation dehydrogenase
MQVRRCAIVHLEPRVEPVFELDALLAGGNGLVHQPRWVALAPHLPQEVVLEETACCLLGRMDAEHWVEASQWQGPWEEALQCLLQAGLVLDDSPERADLRERDDALRQVHWHPLSATYQAFTRWQHADAVEAVVQTGTATVEGLRARHGPPPPAVPAVRGHGPSIALPAIDGSPLLALLERRVTCRNFDRARPLPLFMLAGMLDRVFRARSQLAATEDMVFLKKTSPSGGSLHPLEAYLVLRNVQGLKDGPYHYDAVSHALQPLPLPPGSLQEVMLQALAGQYWFADAPVMVALCPRYERNFWKYRQHAKAWRAVVLEAGHFSQTWYLAATEMGLGAYVTCAINETVLESVFGLDPAGEGVLAVCGLGWRAATMATPELDPAGHVWPGRD